MQPLASSGLVLLVLLSHSTCSLAFQPPALLSAGIRPRSAARMPLRCSMMQFSVDAEIAQKQAEQNSVWQSLSAKMAARVAAQEDKRKQDGTMLFFANMLNGGVSQEDQAVQQEMKKMEALIADLQKLQATRAEERAAEVEKVKALLEAKAKLIDACRAGPMNGVGASEQQTQLILDCAKAVEAGNPTSEPACSPLLDGTWTLLFTSNQGSSAGKLGPFVGEVTQEIDAQRGRYLNRLNLWGLLEAVLGAEWEVEGSARWKVTFNDISFRIFGAEVLKKEFAGGLGSRDSTLDSLDKLSNSEYEGSAANGGYWDMSYTDADLRVLYTTGVGRDPTKKSIFVLQKKP